MHNTPLKSNILKLIVLSLPFSGWSPLGIPYTGITFLLIYIYFVLSLLNFKRSFSLDVFKKIAFPVLIVWLIMLCMTIIYYVPGARNAGSILRLIIFYWLLFYLGVKDTSEMHKQQQSLIPFFLYAVIITAIIFTLNIDPGTDTEGRKTVMGMNSNMLGQYGTFAVIMSVDILVRKPYYAISRGLLFIMLPVFLYMVAGTGSRGAVLSLAGGLLVYFVFYKGKTRVNPLALFSVLLFGVLAVNYLLSTELIAGRMEELEDDYRLRVLWPTAIEIFKKFPVFGTGAARFEIEMATIMGRYRPLHNEFLTVLTYTGLVGMFFFLSFFKKLFTLAMHWRKYAQNPLPLTLLFILMFFLFKAGGGLVQAYVWAIFIILAVPFSEYNSKVNK